MTFLLSLSRYSIRNPTVSDICDTSPCQNGGSCQSFDLGRQYTCSCQGGWTGQDCQIAPDPCRSRPCRNNGECTVNTIGEVDCQCTTGYSGAFCEIGTLPTVWHITSYIFIDRIAGKYYIWQHQSICPFASLIFCLFILSKTSLSDAFYTNCSQYVEVCNYNSCLLLGLSKLSDI